MLVLVQCSGSAQCTVAAVQWWQCLCSYTVQCSGRVSVRGFPGSVGSDFVAASFEILLQDLRYFYQIIFFTLRYFYKIIFFVFFIIFLRYFCKIIFFVIILRYFYYIIFFILRYFYKIILFFIIFLRYFY